MYEEKGFSVVSKYLTEEKMKELLVIFMDKRIEQLENDFEGSERYVEMSGKKRNVFEMLEKSIGTGDGKTLALINVLYDNSSDTIAYTQDFFYEQGFRDALSVVKLMREL